MVLFRPINYIPVKAVEYITQNCMVTSSRYPYYIRGGSLLIIKDVELILLKYRSIGFHVTASNSTNNNVFFFFLLQI